MKKHRVLYAADLFCGAGGSSTGLAQACATLSLKLNLFAINHWPVAIATHSANHVNVRHLCEELNRNLIPSKATGRERLDILIASPECTHHSIARGGKPSSAQSRASAKHVIRWARDQKPQVIIVENVREFLDWGPLGTNGRPLKRRRGEFYRAWVRGLERLGYRVEHRILNAADYGDPTTRKRLFIMARADKKPIIWPEPTHFPAGGVLGRLPWKPAKDIINWKLPSQSIFTRKKPLAPATLERIAAGLKKFGGKAAEPFLIVLRRHAGARSLDHPMPTLTAGGQHFGLCEPDQVQPFVMPLNHGADDKRSYPVTDPLGTITSADTVALVEPFIAELRGGKTANGIGEPLSTVTTKGAHHALVEPFVVPFFGERDGQKPRTHSINEPLATVTGQGAGALVEPFVVAVNHGQESKDPNQFTRRTYGLDKPIPTLTNRGNLGLVEPFILPQRSDSAPRSVDRPVPTVTTTSRGIGVVEPFILPHRTKDPIRDIDKPLQTVTATSSDMALVEPFVIGQQSGAKPRSTKQPLPTVATAGAISLVEPCLVKYNGTADARPVSIPLDTITAKDRFGLVEYDGMLLDIRFRMLQPSELAAAMSFPEDYKFTGTREQRVKQIGNAVAVKTAKALCLAALRMIE